jgi:hypothetical protein
VFGHCENAMELNVNICTPTENKIKSWGKNNIKNNKHFVDVAMLGCIFKSLKNNETAFAIKRNGTFRLLLVVRGANTFLFNPPSNGPFFNCHSPNERG